MQANNCRARSWCQCVYSGQSYFSHTSPKPACAGADNSRPGNSLGLVAGLALPKQCDGREFFTAELGAKQLGLLRENECWASCFWAIQVTIAAASRHREYKTHV